MKTALLLVSMLLTLDCSGAEKKVDESATQPQAARPEGMVEEDVEFEAAGMTIYGTITRPAGKGPFAAIAVAAGSGPTDRNWENPIIPGNNGSARLLATALAHDGVAMLRYDKRGTGKTGMPSAPIAWGDYAAELSAALQVLAGKAYVDPTNVYVAGHSEGGVHALRVAAAPPVPIAGVILLSAAGRSLRDIVVWQISNQLRAALPPDSAQSEIDAFVKAIDRVAAGEAVNPQQVGTLPGVQNFLVALQNPQSIAFARELLKYDPLAAFANFELPVLLISGARDIQVDPLLDTTPLAAAAKAAGRPTRLVIVEEADHVLKLETTPRDKLTPAVGAQYNAAGRILNPEVSSTIVEFLTMAD